jgi:hypothetical protein
MADLVIHASLGKINEQSHNWMDQNKVLVLSQEGPFLFKNNANGMFEPIPESFEINKD